MRAAPLFSQAAAIGTADRLIRRLSAMLGRRRDYKRLKTMPGMGRVIASIFVAVIDGPHRFPDKRKPWRYAGLGV